MNVTVKVNMDWIDQKIVRIMMAAKHLTDADDDKLGNLKKHMNTAHVAMVAAMMEIDSIVATKQHDLKYSQGKP